MAGINPQPHYFISPTCLTPDPNPTAGVKWIEDDWYDITADNTPVHPNSDAEGYIARQNPAKRLLAKWYDAAADMTVGVPGVSALAVSHAVQIVVKDNESDVAVTIKQSLNGTDFDDMPTPLTFTFAAGSRTSHIFNLAGFSANVYQIVYQCLDNTTGTVAFWGL